MTTTELENIAGNFINRCMAVSQGQVSNVEWHMLQAELMDIFARVRRIALDWQPITDMPDDEDVLCVYPADGTRHLWAKYGVGRKGSTFGRVSWGWAMDPTHFMHLPAPPSGATETEKLGAIRKAITEHLTELDKPGWQPIETAPKDRRIWLYWPQFVYQRALDDSPPEPRMSVGYWKENPRTGTAYFGINGEMDDYAMPDYPPTHWMPLPEPPKKEDADDAHE